MCAVLYDDFWSEGLDPKDKEDMGKKASLITKGLRCLIAHHWLFYQRLEVKSWGFLGYQEEQKVKKHAVLDNYDGI